MQILPKITFRLILRFDLVYIHSSLRVVEGDGKGYNWATLSLGDTNRDLVLQVRGSDARLTTFLSKKKIYCCKIQRSKNRISNSDKPGRI
jgi:hypothetical protein